MTKSIRYRWLHLTEINRFWLIGCWLLFGTYSYSQIPLGCYVNPDGHLVFEEVEPNYNGHLTDTVFLVWDNENYIEDLRNFTYDYLTVITHPGDYQFLPSSNDPSRRYDTSANEIPLVNEGIQMNVLNPFVVGNGITEQLDSIQHATSSNVIEYNYPFTSELIGVGITAENTIEIKQIIANYIACNSGYWEDTEDRLFLQHQLSEIDTVIDQRAIYDYLVDQLVEYTYNDEHQLVRIVNYNWNSGVAFWNLLYYPTGELYEIHCEQLVGLQVTYTFEYNSIGQLITVSECHATSGANRSTNQYTDPDRQVTRFTYNENGFINGITHFQEEVKGSTVHVRYGTHH
jgi:YD repeat-containing protein